MVTVIADKEELPTPVNNGVTVGSNDNERSFQYIKDYQEVNFLFEKKNKIHFFIKGGFSSIKFV
jgi:hypothetical protein